MKLNSEFSIIFKKIRKKSFFLYKSHEINFKSTNTFIKIRFFYFFIKFD